MRRPRPRVLSIGTISAGTLRPEDLIPAYIGALEDLRLSREDRNTVRAIAAASSRESYYEESLAEDTDPGEDVNTLQDLADRYAPDLAYVGSLEGDGACIGVWISWDSVQDAEHDGTLVRSTKHEDARYLAGSNPEVHYALEVNDHGNATLYRRSGRQWREVWSVV